MCPEIGLGVGAGKDEREAGAARRLFAHPSEKSDNQGRGLLDE